jgi:hypothetical protein
MWYADIFGFILPENVQKKLKTGEIKWNAIDET